MLFRSQQIFLIDIELAYSITNNRPNPPFGFGSMGYMSPEQMAEVIPTIKEDIYGLSATMLNLLAGLSPVHFNLENPAKLLENLTFFIGDEEIGLLIANGLDPNPKYRPELSKIQSGMLAFRQRVADINNDSREEGRALPIASDRLRQIIQIGIDSLVKPPTAMWDGLWLTRTIEVGGVMDGYQRDYTLYPGLHNGIAGVLYFIAKAKLAGFNIDACLDSYSKGCLFLQDNSLSKLPNIPPGLYNGAAGFAMALVTGIRAGLLPDNTGNRAVIQQCLELEAIGLDLAIGIAGQGMATLCCSDYLPEVVVKKILDRCFKIILDQQQKDGAWLLPPLAQGQKSQKLTSFAQGVAGITWFLLNYQAQYPNPAVKTAARKALSWLSKTTFNLKKTKKIDSNGKGAQSSILEGAAGSLLVFVKGYEIFQDYTYKEWVEKLLSREPVFPLNNDFSQSIGLAGLGELYLEVARVFGPDPWKNRAIGLANNFLHTVQEPTADSCYWLRDQMATALAGLMEGNSGILHFLLRCQAPDQIGYRLFS